MGEFVDYITSQLVHWARAAADFLLFFLVLIYEFSYVLLYVLMPSALIVLVRFFSAFRYHVFIFFFFF